MRKYRVFLVLCLLLTIAGLAAAESYGRFTASDPEIVYDGAYLSVSVDFTPTVDDVALVDGYLLLPDLAEDAAVREASSAAGTLMGIHTQAQLLSGSQALGNVGPVFFEAQNGKTVTKGFIFVLPPDIPKEQLSVQITADLWAQADGPALERMSLNIPLPEPAPAETARVDTDIALEEILPASWEPLLYGDATPPDHSRLAEVFVSGSGEVLCVQLRFEGGAEYAFFIDEAEGAAIHDPWFILNNTHGAGKASRWVSGVFDPLEGLPDNLNVVLYPQMDSQETATLRIDLSAQTVALQ